MAQKAINSPELYSSPVVAVSSLLAWWKVLPHHKRLEPMLHSAP